MFLIRENALKTELKFDIIDSKDGNKILLCIGGLKQSMSNFISDDWIKNNPYYNKIILVKIKPGYDFDHNNVVTQINQYLKDNLNEKEILDGVSFSFGSPLLQKLSTLYSFNEITLISPAGHNTYSICEKFIGYFGAMMFFFLRISFWKLISLYPNYGLEQNFNTNLMMYKKINIYYSNTDYLHPNVLGRYKNCVYINCSGGHFGALNTWKNKLI